MSDFCQENLDSAPDCRSLRRKLKTNPPPRGFEEFFATLAMDPLVKVLGLGIFVSFFFRCLLCKHLSSMLLVGGFKALSRFFLMVATFMWHLLVEKVPVVPHKAVAEVSRIGNV